VTLNDRRSRTGTEEDSAPRAVRRSDKPIIKGCAVFHPIQLASDHWERCVFNRCELVRLTGV
jgi:hypothetical protein